MQSLALVVAITLGQPPSVTRLPDGSMLMEPKAWQAIDDEVKRLQAVEQTHLRETPPSPLVPILLGLALGVVIGSSVTYVAVKKEPK